MAGMGKRMRPHTLTVPKPLIPVAGKPIVQRLVEDIAKVTPEKIEKIGFKLSNLIVAQKLGTEQLELGLANARMLLEHLTLTLIINCIW